MKRIFDFDQCPDTLKPGDRVLCAISGGADSVCMTHWLKSREEAFGIRVFAAHYEHGIRGEESVRDAEFVAHFCKQNGIPLILEHGNVPKQAAEEKKGLEETARQLRYSFLQQTAEQYGCNRIATAHTMEDNTETVLLNLIRGTGTAGLRGVSPFCGKIVRPLLDAGKADVARYLQVANLSWVEDSTNSEEEYRRNHLRHSVIPLLREMNPDLDGAVFRMSRLLAADDACLENLANNFLQTQDLKSGIDCRELLALPEAVASRVVRTLCTETPSSHQVQLLLQIAAGTECRRVEFGGVRFWVQGERLYLMEPESVPDFCYELSVPGKLEIRELGLQLCVDECLKPVEINGLFKTYLFAKNHICGRISCTGRKAGDAYEPKGRGCTKKVKQLLLENKLSPRQRRELLVLRDENGILAVSGFPAAERVSAGDGEEVIRVRILPMGK